MPNPDAIGPDNMAFAGGGSGGHLTPAIAVAEELLELRPDLKLTFFTSSRGVDQRILSSAGLMHHPQVSVVPQPVLSGNNLGRHPLRFLRSLTASVNLCRQHLREHPCGFLLGLGGFASVPAIVASGGLQIPLALLETNSVPGRANRLLSRLAVTTFTGWPFANQNAARWKSSLQEVGVPLRRDFHNAICSGHEPRTLLVLGGSQGAARLNRLVLQSLSQPDVVPADWEIVHQTGVADCERVRAGYDRSLRSATVIPFIDDVAVALQSAAVVISRAGAVTLAEIAASARPAVLVPLSSAADQHQHANAACFSAGNTALVVDELSDNAIAILCEHLCRLCGNAELRRAMAMRAARLSRPDAASEVARQILSRMVDSEPVFRAHP